MNGFAMRSDIRLLYLAALGLLALPIASAGTATALTLFDQEVVCPIDNKPFKTKVVGSYSQFGMRLDRKPLGALLAPLPLPVCPDNGFVMYQRNFTDSEIAALKAIVLTDDYRKARQAHTDHYMVAYMVERTGGDAYALGDLYLKASWEAERSKPELAAEYRALALKNFDQFLKADASRSVTWWNAALTGAELERMLSHFDAVEARLSGLPADLANSPEVQEAAPVLLKVIEQIRSHARNRNAAPENFERK